MHRTITSATFGMIFLFLALGSVPSEPSTPAAPGKRVSEASHRDLEGDPKWERFREIMWSVGQEATEPTASTRAEFCALLKEMGLGREETLGLRFLVTGPGMDYQKMFWEEALLSYQSGRAVKSVERHNMEALMAELQLPDWDRVERNDSMMAAIAAREPVETQHGTVVFDETYINETLQRVQEATGRVDHLMDCWE